MGFLKDTLGTPWWPFANLARNKWSALISVAAGVFGGYLADRIGVPLGWMIGSMVMTGLVSLAGVRLRIPGLLRWAVLSVIGVYLGASFSPEVLDGLSRSVFSVLAMLVMVALEVTIATWVLRRALATNFVTAYTACMPGGFSTMLVIAREYGGDEETVALLQLMRVVVVIVTLSLTARYFVEGMGDVVEAPPLPPEGIVIAAWLFLLGLLACLVTKLPILCMLVPMMLGAGLQTYDVIHLTLPREPLSVALLVLGAAVGSRWGAMRSSRFVKCLLAGLALGLFLLIFSASSAWLVARLLELELLPVLLALAPGGVAEISLIAVALDIEPSFVALHHLVRVFFIFASMPLVLHCYKAFSAGNSPSASG